jgi:hypothetical protein
LLRDARLSTAATAVTFGRTRPAAAVPVEAVLFLAKVGLDGAENKQYTKNY